MRNVTILVLITCLLPVLLASGQEPTSSDVRWKNLKNVKPGTKISVFVISGDWIRGKFARVESKELYLKFRNEEIRLKRENIRTITQAGKGKSPTLIGATIGFAAAATFVNYMFAAYGEGYNTVGDHLKRLRSAD